ncbi:MAG: MAPEG family protein [Porticoccaceae bacterium]|jgi:uncharacterized MAPEG superfamily protein
MTLAYSCVLIAIVLPYVWAGYAKKSLIKSGKYDNNASRPLLENLRGAEQRANWAQANSYESLPGFIGAVIIAHLAGAPQIVVDVLAVTYVVCRVAYGICYIRDLATARSLFWAGGFFAIIGLFVAAF